MTINHALETRNPGALNAGIAAEIKGQGSTNDAAKVNRFPVDCPQTPVPLPVVGSVRMARTHLLAAQFKLDDHGYHCRLLDGLQDGAATLLAEWDGRSRPSIAEELSAYVVEAAMNGAGPGGATDGG